jgi:hypothetical protein
MSAPSTREPRTPNVNSFRRYFPQDGPALAFSSFFLLVVVRNFHFGIIAQHGCRAKGR